MSFRFVDSVVKEFLFATTQDAVQEYLCSSTGDGTPLQYSCLENPMDGGTWWAAVYGVAQSRTQLK